MNEHHKILTLEECLKQAHGTSGRVFGDSYAGIYVIRTIKTERDIPLAEGGKPLSMIVSYHDFRDRPPYEREFEVEEHLADKAFPGDLLLKALQELPNSRTEYLRGVLESQEVLVQTD